MNAPTPQDLLARFNDNDLVKAYIGFRDAFEAAAKKFKDDNTPTQQRMALIENEMLRRLNERKSDNTACEAGTAFKVTNMTVKTLDKAAFHKYAIDNYETVGKDMLTAAISREALSTFIEKTKSQEHPDGMAPPGISVSYSVGVQFRRS